MANPVKAVPDGCHPVSPHLIIGGVDGAIAFYQRAFGAELLHRMPTPDGRIMHAAIRIGDSTVTPCDEFPEWGGPRSSLAMGGTAVTIHLSVEDGAAVFARAVAAGATVKMPVDLRFWGDRYGKLVDPFGPEWSLATHVEDLTPEEIARRASAAFSTPEPCGTAKAS